MSEFDEILSFDPVAEAQRITSMLSTADPKTSRLAMLLLIQHRTRLIDELLIRGDFYPGISLVSALQIAAGLGFNPTKGPVREQGQFLLERDGVVLELTSQFFKGVESGPKLTKALLNVNWKGRHEAWLDFPLRAVGDWQAEGDETWVFAGSLDVTVGLVHYLDRLTDVGQLLKV